MSSDKRMLAPSRRRERPYKCNTLPASFNLTNFSASYVRMSAEQPSAGACRLSSSDDAGSVEKHPLAPDEGLAQRQFLVHTPTGSPCLPPTAYTSHTLTSSSRSKMWSPTPHLPSDGPSTQHGKANSPFGLSRRSSSGQARLCGDANSPVRPRISERVMSQHDILAAQVQLGDIINLMRSDPTSAGRQEAGCEALTRFIETCPLLSARAEVLRPMGNINRLRVSRSQECDSHTPLPKRTQIGSRSVSLNGASTQERSSSSGSSSHQSERHQNIAARGILQVVLAAMRTHPDASLGVHRAACSTIAALAATSANNQYAVATRGGIHAAVATMIAHPQDVDLQYEACKLLRNATAGAHFRAECRAAAVRAGALDVTLNIVEKHTSAGALQTMAYQTLCNMAYNNLQVQAMLRQQIAALSTIERAVLTGDDEQAAAAKELIRRLAKRISPLASPSNGSGNRKRGSRGEDKGMPDLQL